MYKVYSYRDGETLTFTTDSKQVAYLVGYNEVTYLGCRLSYVTDNLTGEIIKIYGES